jgi:hypothetical protein
MPCTARSGRGSERKKGRRLMEKEEHRGMPRTARMGRGSQRKRGEEKLSQKRNAGGDTRAETEVGGKRASWSKNGGVLIGF